MNDVGGWCTMWGACLLPFDFTTHLTSPSPLSQLNRLNLFHPPIICVFPLLGSPNLHFSNFHSISKPQHFIKSYLFFQRSVFFRHSVHWCSTYPSSEIHPGASTWFLFWNRAIVASWIMWSQLWRRRSRCFPVTLRVGKKPSTVESPDSDSPLHRWEQSWNDVIVEEDVMNCDKDHPDYQDEKKLMTTFCRKQTIGAPFAAPVIRPLSESISVIEFIFHNQ